MLKAMHEARARLDLGNYDKRTIGHVAACFEQYGVLEYLAEKTEFNFGLEDRWGVKVWDEVGCEEWRRRLSGK